jgi:hypothetical protein
VFTMVLVRLSIPALLLLATKRSTAASASACAPFCVFADIFGAGAPPLLRHVQEESMTCKHETQC